METSLLWIYCIGITNWSHRSILFACDPYQQTQNDHLLTHQRLFLNLDDESAKEEARWNRQEREIGYSNADVVVKLQAWDPTYSKSVSQASLSALKQLIILDKGLPGNKTKKPNFWWSDKQNGNWLFVFEGKKSLYIRLGCRCDWPNIKPPGWGPSSDTGAHPSFSSSILKQCSFAGEIF